MTIAHCCYCSLLYLVINTKSNSWKISNSIFLPEALNFKKENNLILLDYLLTTAVLKDLLIIKIIKKLRFDIFEEMRFANQKNFETKTIQIEACSPKGSPLWDPFVYILFSLSFLKSFSSSLWMFTREKLKGMKEWWFFTGGVMVITKGGSEKWWFFGDFHAQNHRPFTQWVTLMHLTLKGRGDTQTLIQHNRVG